MAWAEQCKVEFEMTVMAKRHIGKKKKAIDVIIRDVANESGIPFGTLKRWWYDAQKEKSFKNERSDTTIKDEKENEQEEAILPAHPICKQCQKNTVYYGYRIFL